MDDILEVVVAKVLVRGVVGGLFVGGTRAKRGNAGHKNGAAEGQSGAVELRRVERKRRAMMARWLELYKCWSRGRISRAARSDPRSRSQFRG